MKILIAPDKFKGNMTSPEVCEVIGEAFRRELPHAQLILLPMADGGEGTAEALTRANHGSMHSVKVHGPRGKEVTAQFGVYDNGKSAVLEMSSASGLSLLKKEERDVLHSTTFGTGELIKAALDLGVTHLTVGIGGSATVDGGTGMARALGFRFFTAEGKELTDDIAAFRDLAYIDDTCADPRLKQITLSCACDVNNPLLGPSGAAAVYGPQKGATPEMVAILEKSLEKLSQVLVKQGMVSDTNGPGDGAAGGLGTALRAFCRARMISGAKLLMKETALEKYLPGTDLLITGEGCTDSQTEEGKICSQIALLARQYKVKTLLLSGALKGDPETVGKLFDYAFSTSTGAHASIEEAIAAGKKDLAFTAGQIAKLLRKGIE